MTPYRQNLPPLNPQEQQVYSMLQARGQANGQVPGLQATLTPPDNTSRWFGGVPFKETPVYEPMPWLAVDPNIGYNLNDRVVTLTNPTINVESITRLGFDVPTVCYCMVGTAIDTTATDFPVGLDPRDTFTVQFELSNGQRWQTLPELGGNVLGTAQRPRKLGRPGWTMNNGAVLLVRIVPLRENLRIDVAIWTLEQPGPTNIATG